MSISEKSRGLFERTMKTKVFKKIEIKTKPYKNPYKNPYNSSLQKCARIVSKYSSTFQSM